MAPPSSGMPRKTMGCICSRLAPSSSGDAVKFCQRTMVLEKATSMARSWGRRTALRNPAAVSFSPSMKRRTLPLRSTRRATVSGRVVSRAKYLICCGLPSSRISKSSCLRSVTRAPRLSETVARTLTTSTSILMGASCAARTTATAVRSTAVEIVLIARRIGYTAESHMTKRIALFAIVSAAACLAQQVFTPGVKPFIATDAPVIAIEHVRVIDGTGAEAKEDQTIVIDHGRILSAGPAGQAQIPAGAERMDRKGYTVIPGLVGMHEHLFYPSFGGVALYIEHGMSFPRLYLATGVTTARTAGTLEPYTDLNLKKMIDRGAMPGPKMLI